MCLCATGKKNKIYIRRLPGIDKEEREKSIRKFGFVRSFGNYLIVCVCVLFSLNGNFLSITKSSNDLAKLKGKTISEQFSSCVFIEKILILNQKLWCELDVETSSESSAKEKQNEGKLQRVLDIHAFSSYLSIS